MKDYSDTEIITSLRNRESKAVSFLWNRYMPMVRLIVIRNSGSAEDAKDIFQESLMIILEKIDSREFVLTCSFKTYLYCVCENLWRSVLDKKRAASNYLLRIANEEKDKDNDPGDMMDNKVQEEIFREAFESLDPSARNVLKLYWDDVPAQEIAEKLGYSYGFVRKKKCEAQAELTERVKNHPGYRQFVNSEKMAGKVVH